MESLLLNRSALHINLQILVVSFQNPPFFFFLVAEMTQWVKVHATKPDDLSYISGTHSVEEKQVEH